MYEKFTDRARKVMQLANLEAMRFNHEYIGTEHVLLGLIKEGSGVAANALKNLDVDLRKIRLETEKLIQSGADPVTKCVLPQTPRAKKVIENSIDEARKLNHSHVGTEHILLGLLREEEGVAAQILMNLGLRFAAVHKEVLKLRGCDFQASQIEEYPADGLTDEQRMKKAIELAEEMKIELNRPETEICCTRQDRDPATKVLYGFLLLSVIVATIWSVYWLIK